MFDDVRLLVTDTGDKGRERDAVLTFGESRISLLENAGGPPIASLPYKAVTGAFYSRSKRPKWKDAEGKEVESKVDLGRLGFFRGERNWLILTTASQPVVLRFDNDQMNAILSDVQGRTGLTIQR